MVAFFALSRFLNLYCPCNLVPLWYNKARKAILAQQRHPGQITPIVWGMHVESQHFVCQSLGDRQKKIKPYAAKTCHSHSSCGMHDWSSQGEG